MRALFLFGLIGYVAAKPEANQVNLVENTSSNVYLESKNNSNTIGYSFSLYQNVLTVMVNATTSKNQKLGPARYAVIPNLILEYNSTVPATNTTSITGFLNKGNNNKEWGNGLKVTQHSGGLYEIDGNWTDTINNGRPQFHAKMFVATSETNYNGLVLEPNEITMLFSILNYNYTLKNSTLAFDEIVLSGASLNNVTISDVVELSSSPVAVLMINDTALVDGKTQSITIGSLNDTNLDITVGNSTDLNVTGLVAQDVLLTFKNSNGAKNVTFEERLQLNVSALNSMSGMEGNAAISLQAPKWIGALLSVMFAALALPFAL